VRKGTRGKRKGRAGGGGKCEKSVGRENMGREKEEQEEEGSARGVWEGRVEERRKEGRRRRRRTGKKGGEGIKEERREDISQLIIQLTALHGVCM
jgi:hypothetical protein